MAAIPRAGSYASRPADNVDDFDFVLLGEILTQSGRAKEALTAFDHAHALQKKHHTVSNRGWLLVAQAEALRALHDPRVLAILETAVKEADRPTVSAYHRGAARFALAQTISDACRARTLAEQARRDFAAAYARGARRLPAVEAWLKAH